MSLSRSLGRGFECHRGAVHAVPLPRWRRPIVEHMADVTAAPPAVHLGANLKQTAIDGGADRVRKWRGKTRPPRSTLEFCARRVQREIASCAVIDPFTMLVVQRTRARAFRLV